MRYVAFTQNAQWHRITVAFGITKRYNKKDF